MPLLPHLYARSVRYGGVGGVYSESPRKRLFGDVWVGGGGGGAIPFRKLAVTVDGLGFFACSSQGSDRLHCIPKMWSMIVIEPLVLISSGFLETLAHTKEQQGTSTARN